MSNKLLYLKNLFLLFNISVNCNENKDIIQFLDMLLVQEFFKDEEKDEEKREELIKKLGSYSSKIEKLSVELINKILKDNLKTTDNINEDVRIKKIEKIMKLLEFYVENYNLLNDRIINKSNYKKATNVIFKKLIELKLIDEKIYEKKLTQDLYNFINEIINKKNRLSEEYTIADFTTDLQFYCADQLSFNMSEFDMEVMNKILFFYFYKSDLFSYMDKENKKILPVSVENVKKIHKTINESINERLSKDDYLVPIACAMIHDNYEAIIQLKTLTGCNDKIIPYINRMAKNFHEQSEIMKQEIKGDYFKKYLFLNYDENNPIFINFDEDKKIESVNQSSNSSFNGLTEESPYNSTLNSLSSKTNNQGSFERKVMHSQLNILKTLEFHKENNKSDANSKNSKERKIKKRNATKIPHSKNIVSGNKFENNVSGSNVNSNEYLTKKSKAISPYNKKFKIVEQIENIKNTNNKSDANSKNSKERKIKKRNATKISHSKNIVSGNKFENQVNFSQLYEYPSQCSPKYFKFLNAYNKKSKTEDQIENMKIQESAIYIDELDITEKKSNEIIQLDNAEIKHPINKLSENSLILSDSNGLSSDESLYEDVDYRDFVKVKTEIYGQSAKKQCKINLILGSNYFFYNNILVKGYTLISKEFLSFYIGFGYHYFYGISILKNMLNLDLKDIILVFSIFKFDVSINFKNKFVGISYNFKNKKDFNFYGGLGINNLC